MTTTVPGQRLSSAVAEEIRALLARKRMSGVKLAEQIGRSQAYVSRRLTGETAFDVDDLENIAAALGVEVASLLPGTIRRALQTTEPKVTATEKPTGCRPTGQSPSSARPKYAQPASPAVRPYRINDPTSVTEYVTAA